MAILNFLITILIFAVMLTLIVGFHEFGHFIAAKKCGVYVEEFSIGMGPVIKKWKPKNSETTYSFRALPIGGYVSMAEKAEKGSKLKKDRILENKSFFQNFWVFINGIVFNFILAIILFFISGLLYGKPVQEAVIMEVQEGSASYVAGLEVGDKIVEINNNKISNLDDFLLEVSAKKLQDNYEFVVIKKDGSTAKYNVKPNVTKDEDGNEVRVYGLAFAGPTYHKGFKNALSYAVTGTVDSSKTIAKIVKSLFAGQVGAKSLSGPVGIYSLIDRVKGQGLMTIIYLTAYISVNVGIVNLIPIPVFDGGRILILIIEKIIGRKTSDKLEMIINYIGFGLMILLMLFVTFNDIVRLW